MSETGTRRSVARKQEPVVADAPRPAKAETATRPQPMDLDRSRAQRPDSDPAARPLTAPSWLGGGGGGSGGGRASRTSKKMRWVWVGLGLVLVLGALWFLIPRGSGNVGQGRGPGGFGGFGGGATTVNVAEVTRGSIPLYLDALGTVTPVASVVVRSQISGQLVSVSYQEGQMVTRGQVLAQIDPRPYQAQLAQARGVLARDEAQLANARLDLQRYQTLLAQDSISRQQVDTQAATVRQLEGSIASDRAQVQAAELNITYARIVAPISGRVGLRPVDPGNYVSTGDANGVANITQINPIDVAFTMPEDQLPRVAARMRSGASLAVTVSDRAATTELAKGRLTTLDNRIDPATGTLKAKARFENGTGTLFPNQFVNVRILVDTLNDAVLVPSTAVLRGSQGLFVYVVRPDRTVTVSNIQIGPVSGQQTAIVSGVEPGQIVVTDGSDRLREGARVNLPGDCIPAVAQAPGQGGFGGGQGGPNAKGPGGPGGGGNANVKGAPGGQGPNAQGKGPNAKGGPGGGFRGPPVRTAVNGRCPEGLIMVQSLRPAGVGDPAQPSAPPPPGGQAQGQGVNPPSTVAGGPQGGFQGGAPMAMLAALNLDAGQQAQAQTFFAEARAEAMREAGNDPAARGQAFRRANIAALGRLETVLRPDQRGQLAGVRSQMEAGGQGVPGGFGAGGPNRGFAGGPAQQAR